MARVAFYASDNRTFTPVVCRIVIEIETRENARSALCNRVGREFQRKLKLRR